jgi:hypothetical protein
MDRGLAEEQVRKELVPNDYFHCEREFLAGIMKGCQGDSEEKCDRMASILCQYTHANGGKPLSAKTVNEIMEKVKRNRGEAK